MAPDTAAQEQATDRIGHPLRCCDEHETYDVDCARPKCPVCSEPGVSRVSECPYFEDSDHNDAAVSDGT